jgi:hypothetical protein
MTLRASITRSFFQVALSWQIRALTRGETCWRCAYHVGADAFETRGRAPGSCVSDLRFDASIAFV